MLVNGGYYKDQQGVYCDSPSKSRWWLGPQGGGKKWLESVFFSIGHADELGACGRDKSSSEGVTGVWSSGEMCGCKFGSLHHTEVFKSMILGEVYNDMSLGQEESGLPGLSRRGEEDSAKEKREQLAEQKQVLSQKPSEGSVSRRAVWPPVPGLLSGQEDNGLRIDCCIQQHAGHQ